MTNHDGTQNALLAAKRGMSSIQGVSNSGYREDTVSSTDGRQPCHGKWRINERIGDACMWEVRAAGVGEAVRMWRALVPGIHKLGSEGGRLWAARDVARGKLCTVVGRKVERWQLRMASIL